MVHLSMRLRRNMFVLYSLYNKFIFLTFVTLFIQYSTCHPSRLFVTLNRVRTTPILSNRRRLRLGVCCMTPLDLVGICW